MLKSTRRRALAVAAAVALCAPLTGGGAHAATRVPAGTTAVVVHSDTDSTGMDAYLHYAGAIIGQITSRATGLGIRANVTIRNRTTRERYVVGTDANGNFRLGRLRTGDYNVCASGTATAAPYGYVSRCYGSPQWWLGGRVTSRAGSVHVTDGSSSIIGFALSDAGAIRGRVNPAPAGSPLESGVIDIFRHGQIMKVSDLFGHGQFEIDGLPAGTGRNGYQVCFLVGEAASPFPTGTAPHCSHNRRWGGRGDGPSSGARLVGVRADAATGMSELMTAGASIAGVIRSAAPGHHAVKWSFITVYRNGTFVDEVESDATGHYRVRSLDPGRYVVCAYQGFEPSAPRLSFGGRCWRDVNWNGGSRPARGASTVATTAAHTRGGVDFYLPAHVAPRVGRGTISGMITDASGHLLNDVTVGLFSRSGEPVDISGGDDTTGHYRFTGVPASTVGYRVCFDAQDATLTSGGTVPADGFANACYGDVPWAGGNAAPPPRAPLVPLRPGQTRSGISIALGDAGRVSGAVYSSDTGDPLSGVDVLVLDSRNVLIHSGGTAADGSYSIADLTPGLQYKLCFAAEHWTAPADTRGYANQCWYQVDWRGRP